VNPEKCSKTAPSTLLTNQTVIGPTRARTRAEAVTESSVRSVEAHNRPTRQRDFAWPSLTAVPNAGAYGVIVADPPWRFDVRNRETGLRRSADHHYETMPLAEIKASPLKEVAGLHCWLMLWTTGPHLPQALDVMETWGFTYSSFGFLWVKLRRSFQAGLFGILPSDIAMGLGYTTRKAGEPCLLGRRGSPRRLSRDVVDVILAPVREHSRKPDEFYERVEQFAPGPRLDLFARHRRLGWDAWGNELDKFPERRLEADGVRS
jgi:N6-adenosine-specific RNA methylase IME4